MNEQQPHVFVVDGIIKVRTSTLLYSIEPPARGLNYLDIIKIASRIQIDYTWLANQLTIDYDGWDAGPHVADLANLHDYNIRGEFNHPVVMAIMRRIIESIETATDPYAIAVTERLANFIRTTPVQHIPVLTRCPLSSISSDEICAICMESKADNPQNTWAMADGCQRHRFHWVCIAPWKGGTCPTCREPLVGWDGEM